jgi:hypothetical protein
MQIWGVWWKYKVTDPTKAANIGSTGSVEGFTRLDITTDYLRLPTDYTNNFIPSSKVTTQDVRKITEYYAASSSYATSLYRPTFIGQSYGKGSVVDQFVAVVDDPGTIKNYGSETYVATQDTILYSLLNYDRPNPYGMSTGMTMNGQREYRDPNQIRIWVRMGGDGYSSLNTGNMYWYEPIAKRFYVIPKIIFSNSVQFSMNRGGGQSRVNSNLSPAAWSIQEGRILFLMAQGKSREDAYALVESGNSLKTPTQTSGSGTQLGNQAPGTNPGSPSDRNSTSNGSAGTANSSGTSTANIKTTVKVRGNFGYAGIAEAVGTDMQMVQMYTLPNVAKPAAARYYFNPKPNQINYQNLGSDWTEIERVGQVPLVDWKNYKLMKVSFQFIVTPANGYRAGAFGDTADDGITLSIDDTLRELRAMATRPFPVTLFGFDDMLTHQLRFPLTQSRGVEFAIAEFTISSLHRTGTGEINRATCDITLQELPLEKVTLIEMPKLLPMKKLPLPKNPGETQYPDVLLLTADSLANVES